MATLTYPSRRRSFLTLTRADDPEQLMADVAAGHEAAFARLYDNVIGSVFGLARAILRDPSRAEEAAHEVMLEVWQKAARFDPSRGSVKAWVATITRRRSIDMVRSEQAGRDREEKVGTAAAVPATGDPVGDVVADFEDRRRVRTGLEHLTDLQREAIELAYFGGMTYREVAEHLGIPLGTVKTRMRDGLLRLAEIMESGS